MELFIIIAVAVVILFIVLIVVFTGLGSKCPACKKWWSMKELERGLDRIHKFVEKLG